MIVGVLVREFCSALVWWATYRDPRKAGRANEQELAVHRRGRWAERTRRRATHFEWRHIRFLLTQRQIVGASIGQFASNSTLVFFLTWFPTYLATERQMAWLKIGFFAVLPFIAASVGVVTGGIVSDYLLRRTDSAESARASFRSSRGSCSLRLHRQRKFPRQRRPGDHRDVGGLLRPGHGATSGGR